MMPPSTAAAAAVIVCANIILLQQIPLVHGFTTIPATAFHLHTHNPTTIKSITSLWVASATSPSTPAPIPKNKKKSTGKTTTNKGAPNNDDNQKPGRRQARKKQFMMKKWKGQQKSAENRKARQQQREANDSRLVSAVGMSVSDMQKQVNNNDKKSASGNNKKNTQAYKNLGDANKIWNKQADRMTQQKNKKTNIINNKGKKAASTKPQENLLPWTNLLPGSTVSGKVVKALPFGVLVQTNYDIPGRTPGCALLHNNQFLDDDSSEGDKSTATKVGVSTKKKQILPVGSVIENARVINVNRDKGTVNISVRPPTNRSTKLTALQVGDEVEGKVVRLKQYGAFIDVGHKRNALLHLSRMSMYKVLNITDHVRVGQTVKVRILRVTDDKDISVSMLSQENDAFVDRREMQAKRMALWQKVVSASANDGDDLERAKRELLQVDRAIWDQFMADDHQISGGSKRRSMEL